MSRVIVTSSRSWNDVGVVRGALNAAYLELGPFTLAFAGYHGGGEEIARRLVGRSERYPPYEYKPGITAAARQAAITLGNTAMVNDGADLCLAFIGQCVSSHCTYIELHASHGAIGCAHLAERAMIPVRRFWTPWLTRLCDSRATNGAPSTTL